MSIVAAMLSEPEQLQLNLGPYLILTFFNSVYAISSLLLAMADSDISLYGMLCLQCYHFLRVSFKHPRPPGRLAGYSVRIPVSAASGG